MTFQEELAIEETIARILKTATPLALLLMIAKHTEDFVANDILCTAAQELEELG